MGSFSRSGQYTPSPWAHALECDAASVCLCRVRFDTKDGTCFSEFVRDRQARSPFGPKSAPTRYRWSDDHAELRHVLSSYHASSLTPAHAHSLMHSFFISSHLISCTHSFTRLTRLAHSSFLTLSRTTSSLTSLLRLSRLDSSQVSPPSAVTTTPPPPPACLSPIRALHSCSRPLSVTLCFACVRRRGLFNYGPYYGTGGYVVNVPLDRSGAAAQIQQLYEDRWVVLLGLSLLRRITSSGAVTAFPLWGEDERAAEVSLSELLAMIDGSVTVGAAGDY
jgi:hypothetical protein